jgi:hypothetical protein
MLDGVNRFPEREPDKHLAVKTPGIEQIQQIRAEVINGSALKFSPGFLLQCL